VPYSHSEKSFQQGDIHSRRRRRRGCGNVENLSLLTGYNDGGRRPVVMNISA